MAQPLAEGIYYIDLNFLGEPGVIATAILTGPDGVALIDPGPSTTVEALTKALADRGARLSDIRAILLTHIHLDHAGATGTVMASSPHATVYVHELGAPHLADPSKLLSSAGRLYGEDMQRLWGEVRPVPRDRLRVVGDERLTILGHELEVAKTPGHASHHVSYFSPAARVAFVGDTAGLCRLSGRVVLPATPPPDIDLEAWQDSTRRILAWHPDVLFLTHFGPHRSPRVHFNELWTRIDAWNHRIKGQLETPGTDAEREVEFGNEVMDQLIRATNPTEAYAYASAGRFDFSWRGLARYWRKKEVK
jgi:glyoxylase-like metal-dependent hydrolase (beta-lactamase superfamily II)